MPFLSPNQQCQSTEGKTTVLNGSIKSHTGEDMGQLSAGPVNKAVTSASVARVRRYKNLIIAITSVTNSLTKVREGWWKTLRAFHLYSQSDKCSHLWCLCCLEYLRKKGKRWRKWIYIAPLLKYLTLKTLRYGSHSVTCKLHLPASTS